MNRENRFNISEVFIAVKSLSVKYNFRDIKLCDPKIKRAFFEDRIEILIENNNGTELITIPATKSCLVEYHIIASRLTPMESQLMPPPEFAHATINLSNNNDYPKAVEVAVQRVEEGELLSQVVERKELSAEAIYRAVDLLERSLSDLNIHITDLSAESLIMGLDARLYPICYRNIIFEHKEEPCRSLREWLQERLGERTSTDSGELEPYPRLLLDSGEFLYKGATQEGVTIVEDISGWGVIDSRGEFIVEPHYLWISSFAEERAVVKSSNGWGLINIFGEEVIPSRYESIGYSVESGISWVRDNQAWAYFNYRGEQLTTFAIDYPNEDITIEEVLALDSKIEGVEDHIYTP